MTRPAHRLGRPVAVVGAFTVAHSFAFGACSLDVRELDVVDPGLLAADGGPQADAGSSCVDGRCLSVECAAGTGECLSVTRVRRCSPLGSWSTPDECEHACVRGTCGGICTPGVTRCTSGTTVETCTEEGEWNAPMTCTEGCSGDACLGECTPGDARCASSTQAQACNELGQWLAPVSCSYACTSGACGGECTPNDRRCDAGSGLPQACSADGAWQDQPPCRTGEVCSGTGLSTTCICQDGLSACSSGCFDLDADSNNCGACGHSCQGQRCSNGLCEPATLVSGQAVTYRMALSNQELFFINAEGDLNRVSKQGGAIQAIAVATELRGVGIDGNTLFWAQLPSPAFDTFQIQRLGANGPSVTFAESPASDVGMGVGVISIRSLYLGVGTDALRVQDGLVYWSRDGYRRSATTAVTPAAGELLGVEAMHGMLAPAEDCIYSADFTALHRLCTGSREALVHSGSVILDVVTDADGVFFSEAGLGLRRMSLGSDTPTITTLAPSSYALLGLATDASFVYFIDPAADPTTPGICVPGQGSINRVSKDGGEPAPLVAGISGCPRFIAADDAFVYWAAWDETSPTNGYIARVAK
jgi:hypothetical protein